MSTLHRYTEEDIPASCECDNTHEQNDTVCRWCWSQGRRRWNDPEVLVTRKLFVVGRLLPSTRS